MRETILLPSASSTGVDPEGELAVVIGSPAEQIKVGRRSGTPVSLVMLVLMTLQQEICKIKMFNSPGRKDSIHLLPLWTFCISVSLNAG